MHLCGRMGGAKEHRCSAAESQPEEIAGTVITRRADHPQTYQILLLYEVIYRKINKLIYLHSVLCFMTEEKGKLELESWVRVDFRQTPPPHHRHHHLWENSDKYRLSGSLELCLAWIYNICLFSVKHLDVPWAHFSVFREICESFVEGRLKMLRSQFSVSCAEIWKGILTVLGRKKNGTHISMLAQSIWKFVLN